MGFIALERRRIRTIPLSIDLPKVLFLFFPLFLLLTHLPCPAGLAADDPGKSVGDPFIAAKVEDCSLHRFPDPVYLVGDTLPEAFLGTEIGNLRMYRWDHGGPFPIRFQVDERTEEGDWILPLGKKNNASRSNGLLDRQDVIVFLAKDAGEKVGNLSGLPGNSKITTVELADPVDGGRGWVYLLAFPGGGPPLSALPDYVHYDPEHEIVSSACTKAEYLITKDGRHTSFYKYHGTPPGAGGTGENLVDRLKFRVELRFFFDLLPLTLDEEILDSDVVAYLKGPVHVLRRVEQYLKLPLGIRGVKTYADVDLYESFGTAPITLRVPHGFNRVVSSAKVQFGTDYSPNVIGSLFQNSEYSEALIVDGRMSEAEKQFQTGRDRWRIFYGPDGVLMTRTIYPSELLQEVEIHQKYLDDLGAVLPPERFPGSIGYAYTEIYASHVRAGSYHIFLDFYFPPHYRPGDEKLFLQLRDNPLRILIEGREVTNPQDLYGKVGKDF